MRRLILLVVLLALVAVSCGSDDTGSASAGPAADRSPGALDDALEVGGIVVVAAGDLAAPVDGLLLTDFQVETMARELDQGQGYLGVELDRLGGSPGDLPFSYLVAAWLSSAPTETAQAAASLMGEQEWGQAQAIVYPSAVLALFTADALASVDAESGGEDAAAGTVEVAATRSAQRTLASAVNAARVRPMLAPAAEPVTGVCSTLAGWFNDVLSFVFDSLKVATDDGGFLGFLGTIWNAAIDLFEAVVGGLVDALTAPIVAVVAEVIGVIGTLSMVASLLVPWSLDVVEDESRTRFAVGDEGDVANRFTATVDTNLDVDWPASVEDCARVAGFELPDPETALGSEIDWQVTGLPRFGEEVDKQNLIDADNEARYDWITGREASDTGTEQVGVVAVTAIVTSAQIERLKAMLETLITAQIPIEPLGSLVGALFSELAGPILEELAALIQSRGSTSVRVVFHDQDTPAPTSSVAPGAVPGNGAAPWEGNVCELLSNDQVAAIFGGRAPTNAEPADTNTVALDGYGGASCRWQVTAAEYLRLDVFPTGGADLLVLAGYDPWDSWYPELLGGIGDEAVVMLWNGNELEPAGSSGAIIVFDGDVGVRLDLTSNFSLEPVPPGMVAAARSILEGS